MQPTLISSVGHSKGGLPSGWVCECKKRNEAPPRMSVNRAHRDFNGHLVVGRRGGKRHPYGIDEIARGHGAVTGAIDVDVDGVLPTWHKVNVELVRTCKR